MIVAITPNPSIDISYFFDDFNVGDIHRVDRMTKVPGGKGINVAKVLHILGSDVLCTGFLGGSSGQYISSSLEDMGIKSDFVPIAGETRSSLAINAKNDTTEIREKGPIVSEENLDEFIDTIKKLSESASIFSCSGSLPQGLDVNFYDKLLEALNSKRLVLDTSENGLRHVVFNSTIKPYAIKPNIDEIKQLFGEKLNNMSYLEILQLDELKEIPVVVISLGKDGAVAKIKNNFYEAKVPKITAVNPVGSGDSSIAGLLYGIENNLSDEEILRASMACGVLNTLEEKIGHIDINRFEEVKSQININKL